MAAPTRRRNEVGRVESAPARKFGATTQGWVESLVAERATARDSSESFAQENSVAIGRARLG